MKQERNYGIDLLRMVAMFLVVILHILGQGGVLGYVYPHTGQYLAGWYLEIAAMASVNLYALISGYVGVHSKFRVTNIVVLWLQVFFYSFGIAALFAIIRPELCSSADLVEYAFPVITRKYWYFSAYFCLFLFIPLLNAGVNALSKQTLKRIVIAMVLVFSVASSAAKEMSQDPFTLVSGYTGIWLIILYVVGAYIGKYGMWEKVPQPVLPGIFLGCAALSLAIRVVVRDLTETAYIVKFLTSFISPFVVLGSIALLLFFSRLQYGKIAKKVIAFLSPAAFGVYIIHVHPLIWDHVMKNRFTFIAELSPLAFTGVVLLCAFGVYLGCSLLDLLRHAVFKGLEIKQGVAALEKKLFKEKEEIKTGSRE